MQHKKGRHVSRPPSHAGDGRLALLPLLLLGGGSAAAVPPSADAAPSPSGESSSAESARTSSSLAFGLATGLYSGTSRRELYRTPHALPNVFGPCGPSLHCGVFSNAQCAHCRLATPLPPLASASPAPSLGAAGQVPGSLERLFLGLLPESTAFLCEFECCVGMNVGLAAGMYSGTSCPDLYHTPHALHSVFGPNGPSLHCGVFSDVQCAHRRLTPPLPPLASAGSAPSIFGEWMRLGVAREVLGSLVRLFCDLLPESTDFLREFEC